MPDKKQNVRVVKTGTYHRLVKNVSTKVLRVMKKVPKD